MEGQPDPRTDGELLIASVRDPGRIRGLLPPPRARRAGVLSSPGRQRRAGVRSTAETFAAALEAAPRYQPRPEPARGWLYGIAWNKLHESRPHGQAEDAARRALGMAPIVITGSGIERVEALAGGEALHLLKALPSDQRDAVRARVLEGRGYDQIAAQLHCSEMVVRSA
jgi:hypothetical protein